MKRCTQVTFDKCNSNLINECIFELMPFRSKRTKLLYFYVDSVDHENIECGICVNIPIVFSSPEGRFK